MSFELVRKFGAVCEDQVVVDVGADEEAQSEYIPLRTVTFGVISCG